MKKLLIVLFVLGTVGYSCSPRDTTEKNSLVGSYIRVDTVAVSNPETEKNIGLRIVRDTIVIKRTDDSYLVENKRWKFETFGEHVWVNMEHSDNRPFPDFEGKFDQKTKSIASENPWNEIRMLIDIENGKVICRGLAYAKSN